MKISDNNINIEKSRLVEQLVNQLTLFKEPNWETLYFMSQLHKSPNVPRTAILFVNYPDNPDKSFLNACNYIMSGISSSQENIYGEISGGRYLVFFHTPDGEKDLISPQVNMFAERFLKLLDECFEYKARVYVGSTYSSFNNLFQSFKEADFLSFSYSIHKDERIIYFHHYIGDYLMYRFSSESPGHMFSDFEYAFKHFSIGKKLCTSLIQNDFNILGCSKDMGYHRNTINSWISKMNEHLIQDIGRSTTGKNTLHSFSFSDERPVIWNVCVNIQPFNVLHQGFLHLAELLKSKTNEQFQINISLVSASGDYYPLFSALSENAIDCAAINTSIMGSMLNDWPDILERPFLFNDDYEARYLLTHSIKNAYKSVLANTDVELLDFWSMGWREFTSNVSLKEPSDLNGLTIRSLNSSENFKCFADQNGARLTHIHYIDIPAALENQLIHVEDNPAQNILDMKFYKYHKYLTKLKMFYDTNAILVSKMSWERLSKTQQALFLQALQETTEWLFEYVLQNDQKCEMELSQLGMVIEEPTDSELAKWIHSSENVFSHSSHQDLMDIILKERNQYRENLDFQRKNTIF